MFSDQFSGARTQNSKEKLLTKHKEKGFKCSRRESSANQFVMAEQQSSIREKRVEIIRNKFDSTTYMYTHSSELQTGYAVRLIQ